MQATSARPQNYRNAVATTVAPTRFHCRSLRAGDRNLPELRQFRATPIMRVGHTRALGTPANDNARIAVRLVLHGVGLIASVPLPGPLTRAEIQPVWHATKID